MTSVSTTSGDSWSVAELLDPIQAPDCEGSLIGLPAVGPGKDRLAMSHPRCTAAWCAPLPIYSRRYNMSLDLSDDGLRGWRQPTALLHIGSSGYSSLASLGPSLVGVLFSCGKNGTKFNGGPATYDESVVLSTVDLDAGPGVPEPAWITGCDDAGW